MSNEQLYNVELETIDPKKYHFQAVPEPRPVTYQCTICGRFADPKATMANAVAWFCPECKEKLRKLMGDE